MNIEVRAASMQDKDDIRELWFTCFGDSKSFMDWFFSERYFPELSSCLLEDGKVKSAMQSYPLHINIRGKILPVAMVAGVSTHPASQGKGYMRKIFEKYMQLVRDAGLPLVVHTPVNMNTFLSLGHKPATDTLRVTFEGIKEETFPPNVEFAPMDASLIPLYLCYKKQSEAYSGCISRSIADFAYKFRDYSSDKARCFVYKKDGQASGYCVFFSPEDYLHAEECVFADEEAALALTRALLYEAKGKKLSMKLPPDAPVPHPAAVHEVSPQGAMGVADVSKALRLIVNDCSFVFEVEDKTVPQNVGVWDGEGEKTDRAPQVRLQAGFLGQFLCGYHSMEALIEAGQAQGFDMAAVKKMDECLPKQTCFIVDEY
ncbi:GNAT family N-acetyltransferase [Eubacteriales bacterium OttesenSCG-928-K08]|nr:GNAT family N-acetyltransferase [Eubacteriales bacterium OttesenSCG-928-K08]